MKITLLIVAFLLFLLAVVEGLMKDYAPAAYHMTFSLVLLKIADFYEIT